MRRTLHYSAIYNRLYLPAPFGSLFDFFVSELSGAVVIIVMLQSAPRPSNTNIIPS